MEVDPALSAVIRNAGAPVAVPRRVKVPRSLPGESGFVRGVRGFLGLLTTGVAYSAAGRERYGDVYRAPFIGNPMVIVWDADEIHRILRNEDQVWSTAMGWDVLMFEGLDPKKGNVGTLLSLDFDEHRAARKLVQPAFTLKAIEGYLAIARRSFREVVPRWLGQGRIGFKAEVRKLLGTVAGEIFTGIRDPAKVAVVDRALFDFWSGMMVAFRNPVLSPTFRRARNGLSTLLEIFLGLVPERRSVGGDDLFSQLCQVADEDGLGDEAMVRVFLTVMFGAFDTTSAAVTSMAYLLAKHPEWQERLREEARAVPDLDVGSMKKLRQLEWAWKETLRLMPVTSFIPRRPLRDVTVGGHHVAAGTLVGPMAAAIGRHPRWWSKPDTFDPERFSPERAEDKQHPGIFVPFGAGVHACVGMQLANMEVKSFWHELLTRCRFRLTKDYEARHTHTPLGCVSGDVALTLEAA